MSNTGFVVAADLHLAPGAWRKYPEISGDAYRSLHAIVDYCIEQRKPLILAGDIFDRTTPDSASVLHFVDEMARMARAELNTRYVQGNHDWSDPPWPEVSPWVAALGGVLADVGGVPVYGLDYLPRMELAVQLAKIPNTARVLIAHQMWAEFEPRKHDAEGKSVPHVQLLISGDFHAVRDRTIVGASGQQLRMMSPGSTAMQSLDEQPDKYVLDVAADLTVKYMPLPTRPIWRYSVADAEQLDAVVRALHDAESWLQPARDCFPLVITEYLDTVPQVQARLEEAAAGRLHVVTVPRAAQMVSYQTTQQAVQQAGATLEQAVCELLPDPADQELSLRLLQAADVPIELTQTYERIPA